MIPTAYFLNRICVARYLERTIPEECLCANFSYHFEEGIRRACSCSLIKTILEMETLLADYENENHYRKRRVSRDTNEQENQIQKINFIERN